MYPPKHPKNGSKTLTIQEYIMGWDMWPGDIVLGIRGHVRVIMTPSGERKDADKCSPEKLTR